MIEILHEYKSQNFGTICWDYTPNKLPGFYCDQLGNQCNWFFSANFIAFGRFQEDLSQIDQLCPSQKKKK